MARFYDASGSSGLQITPLPEFLTFAEGRAHLPILNQNFGWDLNGVWFGPTPNPEEEGQSYPIFTNFTISQNTPSTTSFDIDIDDECSDAGVAIYVNGATPQWSFNTNGTRIAAQFNCPNGEIQGQEGLVNAPVAVPGPGVYTATLSYNPLAEEEKVVFSLHIAGGDPEDPLFSISLNEVLPEGDYRIGFAADMDGGEGSVDNRTYIRNLSILVGQDLFQDTLTNGYSGAPAADIANFVFTQGNIATEGGSSITIEAANSSVNIYADEDVTLRTTDDDIRIWAADDIRFISDYGNDDHSWRFNSEGRFELPGNGYISNPINSSGDPSTPSSDTIHIVPDEALGYDRYIIIDPTFPNHIHIRPGGEIDNSLAELFLGGERTHVVTDDGSHEVRVQTGATINYNSYLNINGESNSNFVAESGPVVVEVGYKVNVDGIDYIVDSVVPDAPAPGNVMISASGATFNFGQSYTFVGDNGTNNNWSFSSDGTLYGPEDGGSLVVAGIESSPTVENFQISSDGSMTIISDDDLRIESVSGDINLYMDGSIYIGPSVSGNRLAIQSDLDNKVRKAPIPETSSDTGDVGQISWDTDHLYVCVAQNTWKRTTLHNW